jgi:predicted GNAT superfamily acetyltransferase
MSNKGDTAMEEIVLRDCHVPDEMEACVQLQQRVWGYSDAECIPRRMFVVAEKIGGQVLGAWAGKQLAAFSLALPAVRRREEANANEVFLHSHMLAVDHRFRNFGLGRRLKLAQRDEALSRGMRRIEWTFDPLQPLNAHFNIAKLGAIVRRYLPDHYGSSSSKLQAGLPTDRLVAEWLLDSPRVLAMVAAESQLPPAVIAERIALPDNLAEWRQQGEQGTHKIHEAQSRIRASSKDAFARGLVVTGFDRQAAGGEYLLSKESPNEN